MATSINWGTKVITVPRTDNPVIQASPELRGFDLEAWRLELKGLEDTAAGMPYPDTHIHNTTVTLSGETYARTIEIVNGYTVEFEDGSYGVVASGANSNVLDVKVANSVSYLGNNAAGSVVSGSGLSTDQATQLIELWRILGLDASNPMTVTPTSRDAGTVSQVISGDGETTSTVTRQ